MNHQKKSNSVFITGIAGFIGSHLAYFLKKGGDYVIGCDNFNDYYSPQLKKMRAQRLTKLGIEIIQCNIQEYDILNRLFDEKNFTHVIHLAAQAGVRHSITHPFSYSHSNLDGFLHVLELCRHHQPLKLIFASSSSVYGSNTKLPFSESDATDHPISLYAATKKSGELMAKTYHHLYHFPIIGLRYFTVYGPWGRPDMAYYSFTKSILNGKPIPVFNNGKLCRDFTYIDDIIQGTASALNFDGGFEIFNLGNHQAEDIMEMIHYLEKYLGKKAQIDFKPMQLGDVYKTYANIDKAKKYLGFTPTTHLKEGLERFVHWYFSKPDISSH